MQLTFGHALGSIILEALGTSFDESNLHFESQLCVKCVLNFLVNLFVVSLAIFSPSPSLLRKTWISILCNEIIQKHVFIKVAEKIACDRKIMHVVNWYSLNNENKLWTQKLMRILFTTLRARIICDLLNIC